MRQLYLLAYNGLLCAGWGVILAQTLQILAANGLTETAFKQVHPKIRFLLLVCQSAALMEILHSIVGLVKSPFMTTFLQVMSRIIVLYGALEVGTTKVTNASWATQMIIAWALSEILRYSYYFVNLLTEKEKIPKIMTWARYSGFMLLYPMGISGEIACLYNALDHVKQNKIYTVEMPNTYNFSFSYYNFIWFALLGLYPYGSYVMYTYMLAQRKKVLSGGSEKKKTA